LAQLIVVLDATIVNIALPQIAKTFKFSQANLQWIINAYALAFGGLLLLGGKAGDVFGKRKMFMIGIGLFITSSFLGGFAQSQAWIITTRALQGIGGAIASPTALSLITTTFKQGSQRNKAMGAYSAMSGGGSAIGLLLGGILTSYLTWRWVFFINVPIGLVVLFLTPIAIKEPEKNRSKLDFYGTFLATAGISILVFGLSHAASTSWSSPTTFISLALAAFLILTFIAYEIISKNPIIPVRVLKNRSRNGSYLVMLTLGSALFGMFFFLAQFIQEIMGYSPLKTGFAFLPVSLLIVFIAGLTSKLVGLIKPRILITIGPVIVATGLYLMSRITPSASYLDILFPMMLMSVGMGLTFVPLTLTAIHDVPKEDSGVASALLNTTQQIGGSLGLAVLVTISTTFTNRSINNYLNSHNIKNTHSAGNFSGTIPHIPFVQNAVTYGFTRGFLVCSFIALGAAVAAITLIRTSKQKDTSLEEEVVIIG
jgi:EmrB/QacA subfamily drug resistance transporter